MDPTHGAVPVLRKLPAIARFYTSIYGPYPFDAVGAVVDDAENVGYSLETQTKPMFDQPPDEATLAHWSEWIWSERQGQKSAQIFHELYDTPATDTDFWTPPPARPGSPVKLFDGTIYDRGAMTLQVLREKVGDRTFFRILRHWAAHHRPV